MNIHELVIQETLPKKSLFNIAEVSSLTKVKPHEIRYWESEFPQIRSQKNKHGQRLYRKEDVILFTAIKHLLHDKKFTVQGALKILTESDLLEHRVAPHTSSVPVTSSENQLDNFDTEILQNSCDLLPELDSAFNEKTQEIYQHCAEDLEEVALAVEPHHVGEMIADALTEHTRRSSHTAELTQLEYEKTRASLLASQAELNNILQSLEKFSPNDFWGKFSPRK